MYSPRNNSKVRAFFRLSVTKQVYLLQSNFLYNTRIQARTIFGASWLYGRAMLDCATPVNDSAAKELSRLVQYLKPSEGYPFANTKAAGKYGKNFLEWR